MWGCNGIIIFETAGSLTCLAPWRLGAQFRTNPKIPKISDILSGFQCKSHCFNSKHFCTGGRPCTPNPHTGALSQTRSTSHRSSHIAKPLNILFLSLHKSQQLRSFIAIQPVLPSLHTFIHLLLLLSEVVLCLQLPVAFFDSRPQ